MKTIKAPALRYSEDSYPGEVLANFYKDLGWNKATHTLDPKRVKTTESVYMSILETMRTICYNLQEDLQSINLLMLNYGPSVNENVKEGKVQLYNNWLVADI